MLSLHVSIQNLLAEKLESHSEHLNGFFLSWTDAMCLFKSDFHEKLEQHSEHLNGFFPPWTEATCVLISYLN